LLRLDGVGFVELKLLGKDTILHPLRSLLGLQGGNVLTIGRS